MTTRTEQIASGVHRVADGLVNFYLLEQGGEVALVDAGWPRSWPAIEEAVRGLGRTPGELKSVVLTHAHPDHLGAAAKVREQTGATVFVARDEVARARGKAKGASPFALVPGLLPHLWRPSATGFVLHATAHGFMTPTWVDEVTAFDIGDELDVPGRPRVIATPGHTEGHVSLLLSGGVLIAGDALTNLDVLTRETGPRLMPDALNGDAERTRASLANLEGLDAGTILPGHGDPIRLSPTEAVARIRATSP